jgi:hypothetical protein
MPIGWAKKDLGVTKVFTGSKYYTKYKASYREAVIMVRENPEIIADLLEQQGYGPSEIRQHIQKTGGDILPY